MTVKKTILEQIRSSDSLYASWRAVFENARNSQSLDIRKEIEEFSENPLQKIRKLNWQLARNRYSFGKARGAPISKKDADGKTIAGKYRPIVIPKLEARIVQRSILEIISGLPAVNAVIATPYSFGGIRKSKSKDNSIAAVPAAISAVLQSIGGNRKFVVAADIKAFFTRIKRLRATDQLSKLVGADEELRMFLQEATNVELENLAALTEGKKHELFPTHDLGVAQGNSLSPLLGNLILSKFDTLMNTGDCSCIRYIDDFLIIAPTKKAAFARLKKAKAILSELDMSLSEEKSSREPISVENSFEFLGVELSNGFVRPAQKSRRKIIESIQRELDNSAKAMRDIASKGSLQKNNSLVGTLRRVDGMISGWGKHYKFCNDLNVFKNIDSETRGLIRAFLGQYRDVREQLGESSYSKLLGIEEIAALKFEPLAWPKKMS
jgi:RNA-directed DNA polymerase